MRSATHRASRWLAVAVAAVLPGALSPPAVLAAPKVHRIVIERMKFGALAGPVRAGDVILWVNRDVVPHSATAGDKSFDISLKAGASGRTVVRKAGRIAFFCRFHPGMKGSLAVA